MISTAPADQLAAEWFEHPATRALMLGIVAGAGPFDTDGNGIAYSRSTAQVHNIVYLRRDAGIGGGFFPAGTNNSIEALRTSGATA